MRHILKKKNANNDEQCKIFLCGTEQRQTYKLQHVPVKHVVVGETLAVEEIPEKLP